MILKGELAQPASHTGYQYCRKWLHTKALQVKHITKGIYVDGHKMADIIEACNEILKTMTSLGFLQPSNAPNEEIARLLLESWFLLMMTIQYSGFMTRHTMNTCSTSPVSAVPTELRDQDGIEVIADYAGLPSTSEETKFAPSCPPKF